MAVGGCFAESGNLASDPPPRRNGGRVILGKSKSLAHAVASKTGAGGMDFSITARSKLKVNPMP
jgi:hypothetical protein